MTLACIWSEVIIAVTNRDGTIPALTSDFSLPSLYARLQNIEAQPRRRFSSLKGEINYKYWIRKQTLFAIIFSSRSPPLILPFPHAAGDRQYKGMRKLSCENAIESIPLGSHGDDEGHGLEEKQLVSEIVILEMGWKHEFMSIHELWTFGQTKWKEEGRKWEKKRGEEEGGISTGQRREETGNNVVPVTD